MFKIGDIVVEKKSGLELKIIQSALLGSIRRQFNREEYQYFTEPIGILGFPRWHYECELILKKSLEFKTDFEEILK